MAQNLSESYFLEPLRAGEVAFPAPEDLAEPFIDAASRAAHGRRVNGRGTAGVRATEIHPSR